MQLKVVSLNIWDGGRLFDAMIDFCRAQVADVYLFQEVFNNPDPSLERRFHAFEELQKELGLPFALFAPAYTLVDGEHKHLQGNAILSRFPLTEVSVDFYDEQSREVRSGMRAEFPFIPRNLQHVVAETGEKPLHIFNTQGIWGEHGHDTPRRLNMGEIIVQKTAEVGSNTPLVLAGDFNLDPTTQTVGKITQHLQSVFGTSLTNTFNLKQKDLVKYPGYAVAAVDMMFVSPAVRVLDHDCPQVEASDHLPLVATIEM